MDEDDEDEEPSALEYARFYGLVVDHRLSSPLHCVSHLPLLYSDKESEDEGAFCFPLSCVNQDLERLVVSKEALSFLSDVVLVDRKAIDVDAILFPNLHFTKRLKQEILLLRTSHYEDMRRFVVRLTPDFINEHLPMEKTDTDKDHGLLWPSDLGNLPSKITQIVSYEKPSFAKDELLYLQNTLKAAQWIDGSALLNGLIPDRKVKLPEPLTPPLLPRSPQVVSFVPSSETGHIELLSELTSPGMEELRRVDEELIKKDAIAPFNGPRKTDTQESEDIIFGSDEIDDLYNSLGIVKTEFPPTPPPKRYQAANLKVDEPLTPPTSVHPRFGRTKSVSFREALVELIPDLPPPIPRPTDESSSETDKFFNEALQPFADTVNRRIEQEQLQEADITYRVKVPLMDFSRHVTPWTTSVSIDRGVAYVKKHKLELEETHSQLRKSVWPISAKAEQKLRWAPFPANLARVATQEVIIEHHSIASWTSFPEALDIDDLIWKPESLRMYDENDSDFDEIAPYKFPAANSFQALMRKRRLDFSEDKTIDTVAKFVNGHVPETNGVEAGGLSTVFSPFGAIDQFMDGRSRNTKRQKVDESQHSPANPVTWKSPNLIPNVAGQNSEYNKAKIVTEAPKFVDTAKALTRHPAPIPTIPPTNCLHSIIVSSTLTTQRPLFRLICALSPNTTFIERDFSIHSYPEADLLLSPRTALLLMTLTHLYQRPLPGSSTSPLQTRILQLAPRYATLIILIAQGASTPDENDESPSLLLSPTDAAALCALAAFTRNPTLVGLDTEVQLLLVPGGRGALAKWCVSLMHKHALIEDETSGKGAGEGALLADETLWEVWLRRAGLNAYAAQWVLGRLKAPEKVVGGLDPLGNEQEGRYGLRAFVEMRQEERLRAFGDGVGKGVMGRVGRGMDRLCR